jgi:DeoR/GlpR family transcriptional regulator of sugar metabolism
MLMVESEQRMMASADEVIVVADSSKFGRKALARICGWDQVDRVVTDDRLAPEWQERLRGAGAEVILAPAAEVAVGGGG